VAQLPLNPSRVPLLYLEPDGCVAGMEQICAGATIRRGNHGGRPIPSARCHLTALEVQQGPGAWGARVILAAQVPTVARSGGIGPSRHGCRRSGEFCDPVGVGAEVLVTRRHGQSEGGRDLEQGETLALTPPLINNLLPIESERRSEVRDEQAVRRVEQRSRAQDREAATGQEERAVAVGCDLAGLV
jgi:hypothetical protein